MPRHARLQRMIGVLQQMLDTMRSRSRASSSQVGFGRDTRVSRQRRHIEWLCDRDIEALREYARGDLVDTHVFPLSSVRSTFVWGFQNDNVDTLYCGPRPFVFLMAGRITYVTFDYARRGRWQLDLELLPLALEDVVALDILAGFAQPVSAVFPRTVVVSTTFGNDDDIWVTDCAYGVEHGEVYWTDLSVDDYLVATLSVSRVHERMGTWSLGYDILAATRVATTP